MKLKLTLDTYKKISILESFGLPETLAFLIVKDSIEADDYLDRKINIENRLKYLQKNKYKRSSEKLNKLPKKQLINICKQSHIRGYSRKPKLDLINFIQCYEFDSLKRYYKKHFYRKQYTNILKTIKNMLLLIENETEKKNKINIGIAIYQYLCNNIMFLILNGRFLHIVREKAIEMQDQAKELKDNKKFQHYLNIINQL